MTVVVIAPGPGHIQVVQASDNTVNHPASPAKPILTHVVMVCGKVLSYATGC